MKKSDQDLKRDKPFLYFIAREKGTEVPYTGKFWAETAVGTYTCAVCSHVLFHSTNKFDSEEGPDGLHGWPSFDDAVPGSVEYREDDSFGMRRIEVLCSNCKCHLGHLFPDRGTKTGKHFCINSVCLDLKKKK